MRRETTKHAPTTHALRSLFAPFLLPMCLLGCGGSGSDFGGNESGAGKTELHGTDESGDQVCADDPDAPGLPEMDIIGLDIDGSVTATITFDGDMEAWYGGQADKLPFSLQFWTWDGTYIEVLFKDKDAMKVVDGKLELIGYEINGSELIIMLGGIDVENIERARASTFVWSYGDWSGSCDDELEVTP